MTCKNKAFPCNPISFAVSGLKKERERERAEKYRR
jgi:hypothetical protein